MTDKQIIIDGVDVSGCIYYDNGKCLNDEMVQCSCKKVAVCYYKEYKRKEQECEELKEEVQQSLKKNSENYQNSCSLQREVNQLKEQIKRLQEDLKIRCNMYFKESHRAYKLSEISCEWNARRSIERIEKFLMNDNLLQEKILNISTEIKRFFKECTPNKDVRLADFIPEDEYIKCLKAQEQLNQLKQTLTEIKEVAKSQIKAEENNKYKTNGYIVALEILQKISEVEE